MSQAVRVGVVGCGAISGAYFVGARVFPWLQFVACADLDRTAALRKATEFGVPRVLSVDGLLADPEVDVVLNLTVPKAHAAVALAALQAGKHTYSEKPLGVGRDEGRQVLEQAARRGLRVGCAPDTVLGAGIQTARELISHGAIGRPVAFTAFYMSRGHESWHPSPEFFYQPGGGPMFDMGPYYLTALFHLLGPPRRLAGAATITQPHRHITSDPKFGKFLRVETPDHVCGTLEFESGAAGVVIQSFATHHAQYDAAHPITIYGTDGALKVPDPNTFDGQVFLRRAPDAEWREVPHTFVRGYGRSVGLADMAQALGSGRPHRCSGELAYAVLDAMQGFLDSAASGRAHDPAARFARPAPMPSHLPFGVLD
ncbi:MAG TPA: Gfo/Idh/MocA family oxidoreductase [Tepidisphaeraceae bacterium]|nr:Gfo/Idh/MocA family oxidoreductase [Tepidisphaeraceae bacterium]